MADISTRAAFDDTRDLVRRIQSGDHNAEGELVRHFSRGILFLLRRAGARPEEAEDLHQETFRVVLERLRGPGLEQPEALAGFLRGTARNLLRAKWRKHSRRRTEADSEAVDAAIDGRPNATPVQQQRVEQHQRAQLVRRLIADLKTDRDRQILYRTYLAEDDKHDICSDLELSPEHFDRVLYRARQRFKKLLEATGWARSPG